MKKIFISVFITLFVISVNLKQVKAQWVQIPDSNFRNAIAALVPSAISGTMMDTTNSQITSMSALLVSNKQIQNLTGVQYFDQLISLECNSNQITTLPPLHTPLTYLSCYDNLLTSITSLPASLTHLDIDQNQLSSIPTLPASLIYLWCSSNQLTNLPGIHSTSLTYLSCGGNSLLTPSLPLPLTLLNFDCTANGWTSLPSLPSSLQTLHCEFNNLSTLPALPSSLLELLCYSNHITSLSTLPSSLLTLSCEQNQLTSLPVLPTSLQGLLCDGNQLTSLPTLPSSLNVLSCSNNQLTSLPVLPSALSSLTCGTNQINCLPYLPANLHSLWGVNAGYSCLPNMPPNLGTINGPSIVCNQASIVAGGATTFCSGGSVTLNANTGAGLTYQWQKNGTTISSATSSTYVATTSGSYAVIVNGSAACSGTTSSIVVTVNSTPSATITPNGNLNFCSGPGITLQANTGTGLTYQWRKNSVNISGATNSSYLANSTGTFNVVVNNSSGCSKGATPVNVTSPPSITITPSGTTHFCTGGSVTLTVTSGQTVTYKWKKNGAYISGATNSTYVATSTGSYNCVITNSFGCSKGGTPVAVTGPPGAVITANGSTTFCAGGSVQLSAAGGYTYQWIKNSGNINGATQQNYTATTAGNYKVKVTDQFGCSKITPNSNQITVNVPCRQGDFAKEENHGLIIYPNPSSGIFEIRVSSVQSRNAEIEIYTPDGRLIKKQSSETNKPFTIDLTQYADGIYFIHSLVDGQLVFRKIIKQ